MGAVTPIQMLTESSQDADATIDIPDNGQIIGVDWAVQVLGMDALDDFCMIELSFSSTNQRNSNDARGNISAIKICQEFLTSGGGVQNNKTISFGGHGIPVSAGERLYLHTTLDTGVTVSGICMVYFVFGRSSRPATRRR